MCRKKPNKGVSLNLLAPERFTNPNPLNCSLPPNAKSPRPYSIINTVTPIDPTKKKEYSTLNRNNLNLPVWACGQQP